MDVKPELIQDGGWLLLSFLLAAGAMHVAAAIASRRAEEPQRRGRLLGLGALAGGTGLWSMHFAALQVFAPAGLFGYRPEWLLGGLLTCAGTSGLLIAVASGREFRAAPIGLGAVASGAGLAGAQYLSFTALDLRPPIEWQALRVVTFAGLATSVAAAASCAMLALQLSPTRRPLPTRAGLALLLGAALSGVQYSGALAARFSTRSVSAGSELGTGGTALLVAALSVALSVLALRIAAGDTRLQRRLREEQRAREQEQRARMLALHDPETMLRNRASFQQQAVHFIQRCSRNGTRFDLFYGALRFPQAPGEEAAAMQAIAARLRPLARPQDFLARYGKTEFALLREREPLEGAPTQLHEQLLAACTLPLELGGRLVAPQAHVGVGTFPDAGSSSRELLTAAARSVDTAGPAAARRVGPHHPIAA